MWKKPAFWLGNIMCLHKEAKQRLGQPVAKFVLYVEELEKQLNKFSKEQQHLHLLYSFHNEIINKFT